MKLSKFIWVIGICATIMLQGCRGSQRVADSMSYYNFDTTCVAVSPSGMLTLRAWGSGPDRDKAVTEAMKNAVSDVIFKGVKGGGKSYATQAIVTEVNARERYAEYFDRFFADNGEYKKFVNETSTQDKSRLEAKSNGRRNFGLTVDVDRNGLREQLRRDGVINN